MDPRLLAIVFLLVMGTALGCFARAFGVRRETDRHVRWAVSGFVVDLLGTAAVVVTGRLLGWHVPARSAEIALVHRAFAYVSTAVLVVVAVTGARRAPIHTRIAPVFLIVYAITYGLAVAAYAPLP